MAAHSTMTELLNMPVADLIREIKSQRTLVAKLRLSVTMQKEKDSAKYKREKRHLARMLTTLNRKQAEPTPTAS